MGGRALTVIIGICTSTSGREGVEGNNRDLYIDKIMMHIVLLPYIEHNFDNFSV